MFVSIDIGGTNTRVAVSKNLRDIHNVETFASPKSKDGLKNSINTAVENLLAGENIMAASIGVAGIINNKNNVLEISPNYHEINGLDLTQLVEIKIPKNKLFLSNDAAIAALGEATLGAGSQYDSVGYLSIGTGVGGALIINKVLDKDHRIVEPGHHIINFSDNKTGNLGLSGTLESYISGPSFKRIFKQDPDTCTDTAIWQEYGHKVGIGIINLALMWGPACIVLGGGMSEKFEHFLPGIQETLSNLHHINLPKIVKAEFGQGSGIVGGFVLISQRTGYNL